MLKRLSSSQLERATYWIAGALLAFFLLMVIGVLPRFSRIKNEALTQSSPNNVIFMPFMPQHRYVRPGEKEVMFFSFNLISEHNVILKRLKISSNTLDANGQIQSLQLYHNNIFIKEVPFLDTFGLFEDLNLPVVGAGNLEIRGKIYEQAQPGKVFRVGIEQDYDMSFEAVDAQKVGLHWSETGIPVWGTHITVIGR